jgi:large subunit ribosomal protein L24
MSSSHVRKGDLVVVTSGDHKGKTGEVVRVIPKHDHVIVKGVNLVTRSLKPTKAQPQGGQVTREAPLHMSKVSPVVDGKPTRVRFVTKPDGTKVRVAARGGKELGVIRKPRTPGAAKSPKAAKPVAKSK